MQESRPLGGIPDAITIQRYNRQSHKEKKRRNHLFTFLFLYTGPRDRLRPFDNGGRSHGGRWNYCTFRRRALTSSRQQLVKRIRWLRGGGEARSVRESLHFMLPDSWLLRSLISSLSLSLTILILVTFSKLLFSTVIFSLMSLLSYTTVTFSTPSIL